VNDKTRLNDLNITGGTCIFKPENAWLMFEAHTTASSEKHPSRACTLIRSIPVITENLGTDTPGARDLEAMRSRTNDLAKGRRGNGVAEVVS
jgi:hypothetical protein